MYAVDFSSCTRTGLQLWSKKGNGGVEALNISLCNAGDPGSSVSEESLMILVLWLE